MTSKSELELFLSLYEPLKAQIVSDLENFEANQEMVERIKLVMDYSILGGKMNRGISVLSTVKLIKGESITKDLQEKAIILGWCIEWLQAFFLVADDIMDDSPMRRGKPAWYRNDNVGMIAINDSFLIESFIFRILKIHFRQQSYYIDLIELFHEVIYQTELGQMLDLITSPTSVNLDLFNLDKHHFIVKYKTSFYSFYLPVALALLACGETPDSKSFDISRDILVPMGVYFQVQDDYLDLYGDVKLTGKVGTDIKDNKCSWLVIKALSKCNPEQRKILDLHYGKKSDEDEAIVKKLYQELDVQGMFLEYANETEAHLNNMISNVDKSEINPQIFYSFLNKISHRQK
ncbi:Farnesyl pyrophosphate synthase [Smittium mucronatum]|uniref:Farnesyl pyrophosphate synthase n=1 Tax=Smittium mucronatum TaxID=133383 RepID=A0A1R0GPX8_9FUNG|nr:Farnesyl pyrophosphate synthase [Smittium mucronatum]